MADERDQGGYTNTIATRTYGSFEWGTKTPDEVFDALRALGGDDLELIVQVNHHAPHSRLFYSIQC